MTLSATPSRRAFLGGAAATATALFLSPVQFAAAAPAGTTSTKTLTGHLDPGAADWVYAVSYTHLTLPTKA